MHLNNVITVFSTIVIFHLIVNFSFICMHHVFPKLYNYFEDSNYVYLVLEMCHNGEMSSYLKEKKMPFSEDEGEMQFPLIFSQML